MKTIWIRTTVMVIALGMLAAVTGCSGIQRILGMEASSEETSPATDELRTLQPTPTAIVTDPPTPTATPEQVLAMPISLPTPQPTPLPTTPPRRMVTITGASVNIRRGPETTTPILNTVPAGTTFEWIDQNSTGDWYQICCVNNELAWVYAELAQVDEPIQVTQPINRGQTAAPAVTSANVLAVVIPESIIQAGIPLAESIFTQTAVENGVRYESVGESADQGFALTLPNGWQALDLSQQGLSTSLSTLAAQDPQAAAIAQEQFKAVMNARYTFFAAELTPAITHSGFAATMHILKQPLPGDISLEFFAKLTAQQLQDTYQLTDPIRVTPLQLPGGNSVMLTYTLNDIAATRYLIMNGQTVYAITFTTTAPQHSTYTDIFATIAQSFIVLAN